MTDVTIQVTICFNKVIPKSPSCLKNNNEDAHVVMLSKLPLIPQSEIWESPTKQEVDIGQLIQKQHF